VIELNKTILVSFSLLCLLPISFLTDRELSVKTNPKTWTVDDDRVENPYADFTTIQEAINNATNGDKIIVHNGTYYENVVVNKSVSLVGEDRNSTILDGNEAGSVMSIASDNVCIEGFTIKRSGLRSYNSGIFINRTNGNYIRNNTITNNNYGISLYFSNDNLILDNKITDNTEGISLYSSISNAASDNTITDNTNGIIFYNSAGNVVSRNTLMENDYGLLLFDSSENVFFYNNLVENYQQAYTYNSKNDWDHGTEGNYWSDYTGVDLCSGPYRNEAGSDGIGDSSYLITPPGTPARSIQFDYYPLMGKFYDLTATSEGKTYHINTICNSVISEFRFEIGSETGNKIIRFNVTGKDNTAGFCRVIIPTKLMKYPDIILIDEEEIEPTPLQPISNETHVYLYFTYIHSSHSVTIISSKVLHLYSEVRDEYVKLNMTYNDLLKDYNLLLGNYSLLQGSYDELKSSYQEHLLDYSKNEYNTRNLRYVFAAATAIFIMATIYLSKKAHAGGTEVFEGSKKSRP
jgi:parallel beta-helix repeat protein